MDIYDTGYLLSKLDNYYLNKRFFVVYTYDIIMLNKEIIILKKEWYIYG